MSNERKTIIIYICDRCGVQSEDENDYTKWRSILLPVEGDLKDASGEDRADLCLPCIKWLIAELKFKKDFSPYMRSIMCEHKVLESKGKNTRCLDCNVLIAAIYS